VNIEDMDMRYFLSDLQQIDGTQWYRGNCPCCHPEERNLRVYYDGKQLLVGCEDGCRSTDIVFFRGLDNMLSNRAHAPIYKHHQYASFIQHVIKLVDKRYPYIRGCDHIIDSELIDFLIKEMNHVISRCS